MNVRDVKMPVAMLEFLQDNPVFLEKEIGTIDCSSEALTAMFEKLVEHAKYGWEPVSLNRTGTQNPFYLNPVTEGLYRGFILGLFLARKQLNAVNQKLNHHGLVRSPFIIGHRHTRPDEKRWAFPTDPRQHRNLPAAQAEAARLKAFHGGQFGIFARIATEPFALSETDPSLEPIASEIE